MQKRKLRFQLLGLVCFVAIALWTLLWTRNPKTDDTHRRRLRQCAATYHRLQDLEHRLGGDAARWLGVEVLERRYERKVDAERQALLASGYFVKLSATVTNLGSRSKQIDDRLRGLGDGEGLLIFDTQSNQVTVICRPQQAPAYREALRKP
jgi:hypothetical protein